MNTSFINLLESDGRYCVGIQVIKCLIIVSTLMFALSSNAAELESFKRQQPPNHSGLKPLRPLTVADTIAMRKLQNAYASKTFSYSPDGSHFAIVTWKGNLSTGENDYQLLVYDVKQVLQYINANPNRDKRTAIDKNKVGGRVLVELSSAGNGGRVAAGIRRVNWLNDNRTIAFIAEQGQATAQVYTVDSHTGDVKQRTFHDRPVLTYDINLSAGKILYIAGLPSYNRGRGQAHYIVDLNPLDSLLNVNQEKTGFLFRYYISDFVSNDTHKKNTLKAIGEPFSTSAFYDNLWLSPDGKFSVSELTARRVPDAWWQYDSFKQIQTRDVTLDPAFIDENTTSFSSSPFSEFILLDLTHNTIESILDAPNARNVSGGFAEVAWLDNNRVVLGNTFLPLHNQLTKEEHRQRIASAWTVEVNLKTKQITKITNHGQQQSYAKKGIKKHSDDWLTLSLIEGNPLHRINEKVVNFRKIQDRWQQKTSDSNNKNRLALSLLQDLNRAPEIVASDTLSGNKQTITDLNPQFRQLSFGHVELLQWSDSEQRTWKGGLVYPVGYQQGKIYPLVIQTDGFKQGEFLIEGLQWVSGPYAAQALANKGFFVLQLPGKNEGMGTSKEREIQRLGIESAIDRLTSDELIDKERVGLVGFSRAGHYVQHAITFSDYHFAAAVITDALSISTIGYTVWYGGRPPGMAFVEQQYDGAVPWGARLHDWIAQNPVYHLDRVKTPLKLEQYTGMLHWWDIYTILRRQQKPVEWRVIAPDKHGVSVHNLIRPHDRYVIQQENIDWFSFWLKGEEDADPAKVEQYQRWRKLREQQIKSKAAAQRVRQKQQHAKRS